MSRIGLALAIVALACVPARRSDADASPPVGRDRALPVLTTRWFEACNRHYEDGADGERIDSRITLHRLDGGKAWIEDRGERSESHLDRTYGYSAEATRFRNVWRGVYSEKAGRLALEIDLAERSCEITVTDRNVETKKPCPEVSAHQTMRCELTPLDVRPRHGEPGQKQRKVWSCQVADGPKGAATMGGSPLPWIVDQAVCLEIAACRRQATSYALCTEHEVDAPEH